MAINRQNVFHSQWFMGVAPFAATLWTGGNVQLLSRTIALVQADRKAVKADEELRKLRDEAEELAASAKRTLADTDGKITNTLETYSAEPERKRPEIQAQKVKIENNQSDSEPQFGADWLAASYTQMRGATLRRAGYLFLPRL